MACLGTNKNKDQKLELLDFFYLPPYKKCYIFVFQTVIVADLELFEKACPTNKVAPDSRLKC